MEMDLESDGDTDSEGELSQYNAVDLLPTSVAVTRYNNELFNKDDLDEVQLGMDFSSSIDTERSGDSSVISCIQDESTSQLEQIKVLAVRHRREKFLSESSVVSNDFLLPRSSLTEGRGWRTGSLQGGHVFSFAGRGEPVVGASETTKKVDKSDVLPLLPDSLRSKHTKKVQSSLRSYTQYGSGGLEDECMRSEEAKELGRQLLQQGISPVYDPDCSMGVSACKSKTALTDITDLRIFLIRPGPKEAGNVQCHIRREVQATWLSPRFKLYLTEGDQFLLAARKKKSKSSNYIISLDEDDITSKTGNFFGKVRSNFLGTEFWFYDKGFRPNPHKERLHRFQISERVELGAVTYHHNIFGMRGPRKMVAVIPNVDNEDKPFAFLPRNDGSRNILKKYKLGDDRDKMVIMHNKAPKWNAEIGAYCLNFNGRVTRASVKNIQLVTESDKDHVILQFGKVGRNFFTMDYRHPVSALQAFMICLTSLDNKLACE